MNKALHPNQLRPGDHVREYRIIRRLGSGGFSIVFLVEHEGNPYALKMALQPVSEVDEDQVDGWIRREAVSLEHLVHPNLLPIHELGRWPLPRTGYSFFVTDYVPGTTFYEWSRRRHVTPHQWVRVLGEVLRPLEAMHARGICHRDLKADNVIVREGDERPFLIDFGAVHLPGARPLTEGIAPGTLYCQPPEAIRFVMSADALQKGARFEAHPSADLYAVGVLLYEALTGHHPFNPKLPVNHLLLAILSVPPVDPRQLNPRAPDSLCELAMRLLAKDPAQRPASAREVREELERLRADEGDTVPWWTPGLPYRDLGVSSRPVNGALVPMKGPLSPRARPPARRTSARVALALGVGLVGLLGWALLHTEEAPPVEATAPVSPAPSDPGVPPVSSFQPDPSRPLPAPSTQAPARGCSRLQALLGVTVAQLFGCATVPAVRPDPSGYLDKCPYEARENIRKLGFETGLGYWFPTYLQPGPTVSSVSHRLVEEGAALNVKPGPIAAHMYPYANDKFVRILGTAVTTRMRVYIEFDRLVLPDGTWLPICGAAASTFEDIYGIPTREGVEFPDTAVDPAKVDHSPGSVVLNDPQFMTVIEPPEGEQRARIEQVDPNEKPRIDFSEQLEERKRQKK
ncbi:serine/threonine protein kinase [Melittangium boletus]|uniref:Protein kinase domain-containing protein n=1 Tax=Melittangium boletus DSM 14713 TaxID=1294270 RepID=A0A250IKF0_9BACT|nr:serine/threonine-protein kinase [Melittangium boletus]ATB31406.1 hypothetical protein MEBOL_004869 [Melittangium boletus DSM 14713]